MTRTPVRQQHDVVHLRCPGCTAVLPLDSFAPLSADGQRRCPDCGGCAPDAAFLVVEVRALAHLDDAAPTRARR